MTVRELYEAALVEVNKLESPPLLLEDYNYFINKAIQQYVNLVNAKAEIDQQSTDDIRVLKSSTILEPKKFSSLTTDLGDLSKTGMFKTTYYVDLPADYMHLLNCVLEYKVGTTFKCYETNDTIFFPVRRLTPEMYPQIINNAYLRPTYKRPYYYISNRNDDRSGTTRYNTPGDTRKSTTVGQTTTYRNPGIETKTNSDDTRIINYNKGIYSNDVWTASGENVETVITDATTVEFYDSNLVDSYNTAGDRFSNPSVVRLELRFGNDDGVFVPTAVYIDYIKTPMYIRLTQEQIESTLDYSQILEFPDYVCFEIINIFVRLLMENASDPRLQSNIPINNTIINPALQAQQQAQQQQNQ